MSYPTPDAKGKYMALNWIYYNGGATLGSAVSTPSVEWIER